MATNKHYFRGVEITKLTRKELEEAYVSAVSALFNFQAKLKKLIM